MRLKARKATQSGLAAHLELTPRHVSQVLRGSVQGNPDLLTRLAAAVGLKIVLEEALVAPVLPRRRPWTRKNAAEDLEDALDED